MPKGTSACAGTAVAAAFAACTAGVFDGVARLGVTSESAPSSFLSSGFAVGGMAAASISAEGGAARGVVDSGAATANFAFGGVAGRYVTARCEASRGWAGEASRGWAGSCHDANFFLTAAYERHMSGSGAQRESSKETIARSADPFDP